MESSDPLHQQNFSVKPERVRRKKMKKFLTFLLAIAAVFTFSFAAVAATPAKSESKTSIKFVQAEPSPVAAFTVASTDDFTGVISEFLKATNGETGAFQIAKTPISYRQNYSATAIDYVSPPCVAR